MMRGIKQLFVVSIVSLSGQFTFLYCVKKPVIKPTIETLRGQIDIAIQRVHAVHENTNNTVLRSNEAMAIAHSANGTSIKAQEAATEALKMAKEATEALEDVQELPNEVKEAAQKAMKDLQKEFDRLKEKLNKSDNDSSIELEMAKIREKQKRGIFEQEAKIRAQAAVDVEKEKWNNIRETIDDPKRILKIVLTIVGIAIAIYGAKYAIPKIMDYFTKPRVVLETSKKSWFGWGSNPDPVDLNDLIFASALKKQLFDLAMRVQSAKMYREKLPNLLFYGPPGTGKTTFAKALAQFSGLEYAITSGSEFAKITDLNSANDALRDLLTWARKSEGLIVVIEEAESLFANRKLPTTTKAVQDLVNTFLALLPDKSHENVMFIFSTNHPFKLDDAIADRIGINIEFTLPEQPEREKILTTYLEKFATENEDMPVDVHPEVIDGIADFVSGLKGLSPRAIKFIAEEMVVNARRQKHKQLTKALAQGVLDAAKRSLQQTEKWEKEREDWVKARMAAGA